MQPFAIPPPRFGGKNPLIWAQRFGLIRGNRVPEAGGGGVAFEFSPLWSPQIHTHKHTQTLCRHANTRKRPCGWHNDGQALGVRNPHQANNARDTVKM